MAVGNGKPEWARAFVEEEGVDFPVYTDPARLTYKAFGMKSGVRAVNARVGKHGARAAAAGFHQTKTRGSASQAGGIIAFDGDGTVVYEHIEAEIGDLCDLDDLLTALRAVNPG